MAESRDPRLAGESLAARFPALLLAARRVAATVQYGAHGRRRIGPGDTFWQFRRYEWGDTPQSIDWRRSARTPTLYVREKEWEAAATLWIWRDASPSMDYRSDRKLMTKGERADLLTLALASLLTRAGERFGLLGRQPRAASGRAALTGLTDTLARQVGPDGRASLPPQLPLPRFSRVLWLGDFLSPPADIASVLRFYAGRGIEGQILHIIDPAEADLPFAGRTRFHGLEAESDLLIGRVDSVRDRYRELFTAHGESVRELARATGWGYSTHRTDHAAETALLALYMSLGEG